MKRALIISILACFLLSTAAWAARFEFDGYIAYHNDIATINFSLESDATDVSVYTDSFNFGLDGNFDPITALWTGDGELLAQNDDMNTGSDNWDSGFFLDSLGAGDYIFTVAAYNNFAKGTDPSDGDFLDSDPVLLTDGFLRDHNTPIPIEEWALYDGDRTTGMSGYYHVILDGVDSATQSPEPATLFLLGFGLVGLAGIRKKIKI